MKLLGIFIFIIVIVLLILYNKYNTIDNFKVDEDDIIEIPGFLTNEQCDILIKDKKLSTSYIANTKKQTLNIENDKNTRISEQTWISDEDNPIAKLISEKSAKLTNTNIIDQEPLQIVRYKPGGFFSGHYDSFDPKNIKNQLNYGGYRYATILVYLNDNYTGGETYFPKINKVIKPEKGKAVIFYNLKNGEINDKSYHGGNTVHSGEKWICNKWIKAKFYKNPRTS